MAPEPFTFPGADADLSAHAHRTVREILERHGEPSDRALLDLLWAYTASSQAGRDHLFLVIAGRAMGEPYVPEPVIRPNPAPSPRPDPGPSPRTSDLPAGHRDLAEFVRSSLVLIQVLQAQTAGEPTDAPR